MKTFLLLSCICLSTFYSCTHPNTRNSQREFEKPEGSENVYEPFKNDPDLRAVWTSLLKTAQSGDHKEFKRVLFDSVQCCGAVLQVNKFFKQRISHVFDRQLMRQVVDSLNITLLKHSFAIEYYPQFVLGQSNIIYPINHKEIQIKKEDTPDGEWKMLFEFIKTEAGYKLFEINSVGGPNCCR